jgi:hypothetical protein
LIIGVVASLFLFICLFVISHKKNGHNNTNGNFRVYKLGVPTTSKICLGNKKHEKNLAFVYKHELARVVVAIEKPSMHLLCIRYMNPICMPKIKTEREIESMHLLNTSTHLLEIKMKEQFCKVVHFPAPHILCAHQTHNLSLPYFGIFQPSKQKRPSLVTPQKEFCHYMPYDAEEARSSQYDDSFYNGLSSKGLLCTWSAQCMSFFFNTKLWPPSSPPPPLLSAPIN